MSYNELPQQYDAESREVINLITDLKIKKKCLKCIIGMCICCFVIGIFGLTFVLFATHKKDKIKCGGMGQVRCLTDDEWQYVKEVALIGIIVFLVKLCVICKLYQVITNYEVDSISNWLQVWVTLFVINQCLSLYTGTKTWKSSFIEIIVGTVIITWFVWYTNKYAKIIQHLKQEGKDPKRIIDS